MSTATRGSAVGRRIEAGWKRRHGGSRMLPWLPRFAVALVLLAAAPAAYAQYIYLDSNRDGVCDGNDFLNITTDSVDVWVDTAHNRDGSPAVCSTGEALSI